MSAWIVVAGSVALLLLMVLVLVRQGSPASLSDEDGKTPQRLARPRCLAREAVG